MYLLLYDPRAPIADKTRQYGDQGDGSREGEPEVGVRAWAFMRAAASRRMKSTQRGIKPRASRRESRYATSFRVHGILVIILSIPDTKSARVPFGGGGRKSENHQRTD